MTEEEAQAIEKLLQDRESFELRDADSEVVRSYYFDHIDSKYCCLTIDGVTPFAENVHSYQDFSDLYRDVLSQYTASFISNRVRTTMERILQFYELCCAESVDDTLIAEMLKEHFNYELLIWDRDRHIYGYMTPLQALVLRRPAATSSILLLLHKGVNPNRKTGMASSQSTAFLYACSYAHDNEVQLMLPYVDVNFTLEHTSSTSVCESTALMSSVQRFHNNPLMEERRLRTYRLLLEQGADINYVHHDGASAIMKIIDVGHIEYLDNIPSDLCLNLNYYAEVDEFYHNQHTPLSYCAQRMSIYDDLKIIFLKLLELNADINMKDGAGTPPLFYSVCHEKIEVYEHTQVNWSATNSDGQTALMHYARLNKRETSMPSYLLKRSLDINATDKDGDTALHIALRNHDSILALFLLEQGCKCDVVNHNNESPLDIARANNLSTVMLKLEHNHANPEVNIEDLCVRMLEEGFAYTFKTKKITHVKFDSRSWYRYSNPASDSYIYRNYTCTREWIREYFCALTLLEESAEEQVYFLNYINQYFERVNHPLWSMNDLKSHFERSYLHEQVSLDVSKNEVAQACITYLQAGNSFIRSDKEGVQSYKYHPSSQRMHYRARGEYGSRDRWFTEEEFRTYCVSSIEQLGDHPYPIDFRGFFVTQDLREVLAFLGFESWRAWKRASQHKGTQLKN